MPWFFFAAAAPALWAASNHIDKYILDRYFKDQYVAALTIFTEWVGLAIAGIIYLIYPNILNIKPIYGLIMAVNGALLVAAFIPYYYALASEEASIISPLYQTIPLFSYLWGYLFLNERLSSSEWAGGLLIIFGAIFLSLDLTDKLPKFKTRAFLLILLSSFLISINLLVFKLIALEENFWVTGFWEYAGSALILIPSLSLIKKYRQQFLRVIKDSSLGILGVTGLNEVINIVAKLLANFASLLAPLALISFVNGLQSFFVFIYGVVLTLFFPKIAKEKIDRKHLFQKVAAILIMFLGTALIFRTP